MKISGAELNLFVEEAWPGNVGDWYWDHDLFDELADPTLTYDTRELGDFLWQGAGPCPVTPPRLDLPKLIRDWRLTRNTVLLTMTVPFEQHAAFLEALAPFGVKILQQSPSKVPLTRDEPPAPSI